MLEFEALHGQASYMMDMVLYMSRTLVLFILHMYDSRSARLVSLSCVLHRIYCVSSYSYHLCIVSPLSYLYWS